MSDKKLDDIESFLKQMAFLQEQPVNEAAWEKMNALLNKEFGEEKKRRFFIWWWLLPIIIAGSLSFYFTRNTTVFQLTNQLNTTNEAYTVTEKSLQKQKSPITEFTIVNKAKTKDKNAQAIQLSNAVESKSTSSKISQIKKEYLKNKWTVTLDKHNLPATVNNAYTQNAETLKYNNAIDENEIDKSSVLQIQKNDKPLITFAENSNSIIANSIAKYFVANDTKKDSSITQKLLKTKYSKLFISASIAADASFVRINNIEKVAAMYGVGLGYRFNKKWSIQTGIYAGKKIYIAQKQDYDFSKMSSFSYSNNVLKISANCNVIDIPLNVTYNFSIKPSHQWFVSAGLSSFFMKKESYDVLYNYAPVSSATHTVSWLYSNQNTHYFSVLNLSAGYQFNASKHLLMSIEPYYKAPLGGIGEGLIHLSSIGMQLNVIPKIKSRKK